MKRTAKWLTTVLSLAIVTNSMAVYSVGDAVLPSQPSQPSHPSQIEETASDTVELAPAFATAAGEEVLEWREDGIRHYYLGDGRYQAIVTAESVVQSGDAAMAASNFNGSVFQDTYITSTNPNGHYGNTSQLKVGTNQIAYMKCDLPELPDYAHVENAKFYFWYSFATTTGTLNLRAYAVNFPWDESTLNWTTANSHTNFGMSTQVLLGGAGLSAPNCPKQTYIDITNVTKQWLSDDGIPNYGLALKRVGGSNDSVNVMSSEAASTYRPYAVITYSLEELPIEEGTYYIRNAVARTNINDIPRANWACLMQTHDSSTSSTDYEADPTGVQFCEVRSITGASEQEWILDYLNNGYYTIKNATENKVLSLQAGKEGLAGEVIVRETFTGDNRQQWKITRTSNGTYKIQSRVSESSGTNLVMSITSSTVGNYIGRNVVQGAYSTSDGLLNDEWYFHKKGSDIFMLGVNDEGHDHYSSYAKVLEFMNDGDYNGFYIQRKDNFTQQEILSQMEQSKIYVSRSHGDYDGLGSKIHISSDTATGATISHSDIYDFQNNVPLVDLSNCELMLFVACKTAGPTNDINNNYYSICNAAVLAGAEYAVGFTETIYCNDANWWTEFFFENLAGGVSVVECYRNAIDAGCPSDNNETTFAYTDQVAIQSCLLFPHNGGTEQ